MQGFQVKKEGKPNLPTMELALVRGGKAFGYVIPADRGNGRDTYAVAELAGPLAGLEELYKAAEGALGLLERIQREQDGPNPMPWPEADRLALALKGMGI